MCLRDPELSIASFGCICFSSFGSLGALEALCDNALYKLTLTFLSVLWRWWFVMRSSGNWALSAIKQGFDVGFYLLHPPISSVACFSLFFFCLSSRVTCAFFSVLPLCFVSFNFHTNSHLIRKRALSVDVSFVYYHLMPDYWHFLELSGRWKILYILENETFVKTDSSIILVPQRLKIHFWHHFSSYTSWKWT